MLKAALCGSYVNFGVFRLYGDEALDNALNIFVKLLLSIPQSDLLVSMVIYRYYSILRNKYVLGLSETLANILCAFGMFGTGPHEFSGDVGASGVPLYSVFDF